MQQHYTSSERMTVKSTLSGAIYRQEELQAQNLLLSLVLIGCIMFISFAAFQILIRWLIYCLAGFNQLVSNIDAFPHFISVSLSSVCLHGFLGLFSNHHHVCVG